MTNALELALADLAQHIDWPPEVDVALTPKKARSRRLVWVAAVAAIMIGIAVLPAGREAVAGLARVLGIEIEFRDVNPDLAVGLDLGPAVEADDALAAVDFDLVFPAPVGTPAAFHLRGTPLGTQVWTVWEPSDRLPPISGTNAGLIMTQFQADPDEAWIRKLISGGVEVDRVEINGEEGYWMTGPHLLIFDNGDFSETSRTNGNVLIWSASGITYRLETALTLPQALELAQNLESVAPRV
ncbi:MAG: hypothetical protein H0T94_07080 [Acidimicrobiia bacterium]|nr:hypothetical protein [Acidimicrobiia bacterium]MDQ3500600.1 hypothetical protein [Actinomycetota bacterium]